MNQPVICIVGLGYVGLPLAHAFAAKGYTVSGYDIDVSRIAELKEGKDRTNELTDEQLSSVDITYSDQPDAIASADFIIVTLPTPIDSSNKPDLSILKSGTKTVGSRMKKGAIVVFESTVYPGVTEEICGPILEKESGLTCGTDFFLGYSPERINPGDKVHTVTKILKIVAGQDEKTTNRLCDLYRSIVEAGIHRAPNIKVAEMAKAIENAQRDLNIAFVNEIAMMCQKIGIGSRDVLEAAGTKWNFLPFEPGLVGGHCIGVDPYYLVEKADQLGMNAEVISAGRKTNDGMSAVVVWQIINALGSADGKNVLVRGITFKENVPDTRNSKAPDVVRRLMDAGYEVRVEDPFVSHEAIEAMGFNRGSLDDGPFDCIALLVPHGDFLAQQVLDYKQYLRSTDSVLYDMKAIFDSSECDFCTYRSL